VAIRGSLTWRNTRPWMCRTDQVDVPTRLCK
jgi:hypothetical protein